MRFKLFVVELFSNGRPGQGFQVSFNQRETENYHPDISVIYDAHTGDTYLSRELMSKLHMYPSGGRHLKMRAKQFELLGAQMVKEAQELVNAKGRSQRERMVRERNGQALAWLLALPTVYQAQRRGGDQ